MPPHSSSSSHHPLKIVPKELVFPAPLNRVITNILKLHNVSTSPLAYKVKTTAPQRYCVRPNNGVLPPGETIEVQVLLNYVKDAPPNLDTRDKFQIQSIVLSGPLSSATDIGEVWARATPEQITKQKLKSRFTAAATKPAIPPTSAQPSSNVIQPEPGTLETIPPTTTATTTLQQAPPPHDEPASQTTSAQPQPSLYSSLNSSMNSSLSSSVNSSLNTSTSSSQQAHATHIPSQTTSHPIDQHSPQLAVDKKESSLVDSTEYFTPATSALKTQSTTQTKDSPHLEQRSHQIEPQSKLETTTHHAEPQQDIARHDIAKHDNVKHDIIKPTGDYVVDSVTTHSQLRKAVEQVATMRTEREGFVKDSQRLSDQVKALTDQLRRATEENQQVGLRQRTTTTPGSPTVGQVHLQPLISSQPQQSVIQMQTQVLLFIILFFSVIGFLLGRFTR